MTAPRDDGQRRNHPHYELEMSEFRLNSITIRLTITTLLCSVEVAFLRRPSEYSPYLLVKYLVVANRLLRMFSVWASMGPLIVLRDQVDCPSGTAVEDQARIPISRANQSSQLDTYLRIQVITCSGREISKVFSQEVKHILSHWSKRSAIPLTKKVR